jgi:hypothetical protein
VLLGLAALAAVLIPFGGSGSNPGPNLTPTSQTAAPADTKPAQVNDRGSSRPAASASRPVTTATAPGAGGSPSQPVASRTPNPSPTQNASPTNQATSQAGGSAAPTSTTGNG